MKILQNFVLQHMRIHFHNWPGFINLEIGEGWSAVLYGDYHSSLYGFSRHRRQPTTMSHTESCLLNFVSCQNSLQPNF